MSRDNCHDFFVQALQAKHQLTTIPPAIRQALVLQQPDWTLLNCTDLLGTILLKDWPTPSTYTAVHIDSTGHYVKWCMRILSQHLRYHNANLCPT